MEICKSQQRSIDSKWWSLSDTHLSCLNHALSECIRHALDHASVPPYDTAWTKGVEQSTTVCAFILTGSQCHMWQTCNKCSALQNKGEGLPGDLLVKKKNQNVSISATDEYKGRVGMAANSSLLLSAAKLTDQRTFTCMVVADADIAEYPVNVVIYSEYTLAQVWNNFYSFFDCVSLSARMTDVSAIIIPPSLTHFYVLQKCQQAWRFQTKRRNWRLANLLRWVFNDKHCLYLHYFKQ